MHPGPNANHGHRVPQTGVNRSSQLIAVFEPFILSVNTSALSSTILHDAPPARSNSGFALIGTASPCKMQQSLKLGQRSTLNLGVVHTFQNIPSSNRIGCKPITKDTSKQLTVQGAILGHQVKRRHRSKDCGSIPFRPCFGVPNRKSGNRMLAFFQLGKLGISLLSCLSCNLAPSAPRYQHVPWPKTPCPMLRSNRNDQQETKVDIISKCLCLREA